MGKKKQTTTIDEVWETPAFLDAQALQHDLTRLLGKVLSNIHNVKRPEHLGRIAFALEQLCHEHESTDCEHTNGIGGTYITDGPMDFNQAMCETEGDFDKFLYD